ncbi:cell division protein FtsQ [Flavobacterium sp.]|uniref:cell division protein FtsQ/DivIB n=1 Tax=Flavobacterium sp. TaxID=239 RepID=UPI0026367A9E|nr:cell division protein FtsQ [Flavobacterium sp.]
MEASKKRNLLYNIRLFAMLLVLIALYAFSVNRNKSRQIAKTLVFFEPTKDQFISKTTVNKLLIENIREAGSHAKENLDLNQLEHTLNANPMIKKSEVSLGIDGVLRAKVEQRAPVARWVNDGMIFYIDDAGTKMPLSELTSARVPLVTGAITKENTKDICEVLKYINDDSFLKKDIIGVKIAPNGSLLMLSRSYDFKIDFGEPKHIHRKFCNYKAFYFKAEADKSLEKYKLVNLRFTKQVVCTK